MSFWYKTVENCQCHPNCSCQAERQGPWTSCYLGHFFVSHPWFDAPTIRDIDLDFFCYFCRAMVRLLTFTNSAVNMFVYTLQLPEFRQAFMHTFRTWRRERQRSQASLWICLTSLIQPQAAGRLLKQRIYYCSLQKSCNHLLHDSRQCARHALCIFDYF